MKREMGSIVTKLIRDYKDGQEDSLQQGWDYVQAQVSCVGRGGQCEVPGLWVPLCLGLVVRVPVCTWQNRLASEFV